MLVEVREYCSDAIESMTVEEYIIAALNKNDYEQRGQIEDLETKVSRLTELCAKLCNVLADNQIIDAKEVNILVNSFEYNECKEVIF